MEKKVILITGASSGIGLDGAIELAKMGHIVYGAARRVDRMSKLVEAGGHTIQLDVTNETQIQEGVKRIIEEQGTIDVLWNNAGYGLYGAMEDIPLDIARQQFEVNLFGLARITQEVLLIMREKRSGTIINTSSMGGKIYTPLGSWYHATKHALEGWSDCLRLELKEFNVNVVIIEPGAINTEFGDVMYEPMLKYSGEGNYSKLANIMARVTKESYEKKGATSPPSVITNLVKKAISSSKPKTRYVAGKMAKPTMFIRKYFSDRFFDKIIMSQVNKYRQLMALPCLTKKM